MKNFFTLLSVFLWLFSFQTFGQFTTVGQGSYTNNFPGTDAAGRNSYPAGSPQISGNAIGKPVPTNDWYSKLILENHASNLFNYPLAMKTVNSGLVVSYIPWGVFDDLEPITVGTSNLNASKSTINDFSDWTVTMDWNDGTRNFQATAGIGMPFLYFHKATADVAQVKVNNGTVTVSAEKLIIENAHSGADFVVFAPQGSTWTQNGTVYTSDLNGKNYWSMAMLPLTASNLSAVAEEYEKYAYVFPVNTTANWAYDENTAKVNTVFSVTTEIKEGTETQMLLGLLPHQWANLSATSAQPNNYSYTTVRGELKTLAGNTFTVENTYSGILPTLPYLANYSEGFSPSELDKKVSQIENDGLATWTDSYNEGQVMNRLIQTARIADQTGNLEARNKMIATVKERLEDWLKAEAGEVAFLFYYNSNWSAMIGYPAGHGQDGNLNDHHFHWGYFIHAAAFMEQYEPGWAAQWGDMINLLIRDAASPDRNDAKFPFLRNFSPYAGHCWANGFASFPQGNDQESTSESMQFNSSLIHWGTVTGNDEIRDLGIYLYTTEQTAIEEYWFDMYERNFGTNQNYSLVSRVWGNSYDNGTFWTADIAASYGIEMYPIHGGSLYLGHNLAYAEKLWNEIKTNTGIIGNEANPNLWHDVMWEYLAFTNPQAAIDLYNSNPDRALKFGISDAQTYHWLHAMNALGNVNASITANYPIAAVFTKNGVNTYVAHNYSNSPITVSFSDGYNLNVPANQMATSLDISASGVLSADFYQAYTGGKVNLSIETTGTGITKVAFFDGNTSMGEVSQEPFTLKTPNLALGIHNVYAKIFVGDNFNVSNIVSIQVGEQIPYSGTATTLPGVIEAGNYDKFEGGIGQGIAYVDVSPNNDGDFRPNEYVDATQVTNEGATVGWISAGEWLEYTVNVAESGMYSFAFRYASGNASGGGPFQLLIDGEAVTSSISVPSTSTTNWNVWATKTVTNIPLIAGNHVLRLAFASGEFNLGKMTFAKTGEITFSYPVANAGNDIKVLLPATTATLNASASTESTNQTLKYNWTQVYGASTAVFSDKTSAQPTISNLEEGMYRFKVTVQNPDLRTSSDEVYVIVTSTANIIPTVSLTSPVQDVSYPENKEITLSATANDFDGSIVQVDFYQNGELIASDLTSPYSILWSKAAGKYAITAKATDNEGAVGVSQAVNVTYFPVVSCEGSSTDAQQGSFSVGYKYKFETVGSEVTVTFELLDDKAGVVAYLWTQTPFSEKSMTNVEGKKFSTLLSGQTVGATINVACKFAFTGGMSVTKYISYIVGNDCTADEEKPTNFTASVGSITQSSVELLLNATDNSNSVIYKITYGQTTKTVSAASGVETSCIVSALMPSTNYSFSVTASDIAGNLADNNPILLNATTLESTNNACGGTSAEASQGSFTAGYNYNFSTSGADVNIKFKLLDDKTSVVAYLWNTTSGFTETAMTNTNGEFSIKLTGQTVGTVLKLACKFAYAGGMSVTKVFNYTVGDNCTSTNINENSLSSILPFPNPVQDVLNLNFSVLATENEQIVVSVIDNRGMVCKVFETNGNQDFKVDFTNLAKGMYFVKAQTEQDVFVWKVLKN